MTKKQTLQDVEVEIEALQKEAEKIKKRLELKWRQRGRLFEEANADNYGDIEWLVNNPDVPGGFEAMKAWMIETFGGEYRGVGTSGYYHDTGQRAFGFNNLEDAECRANVHVFAEKVLPFLRARKDGFIGFTYATGYHSGIFDIEYKPEDGTWWTSNTRYMRTRDREQHASLDAAIDHAIKIEATVTD